MKKTILLFLFLPIFFTGSAQISSNCEVPDVLRIYYEPDVKSMAVKWLYATKSPDTALIDIPQWSQDSVWSGLAAIFNRHDLPAVDSIFNRYCVHAWIDIWESRIFRSIVIEVDTLYVWTHNWLNYLMTTGVASLDTLMARYGFQISDVTIIPGFPPFISFFTNQYINSLALFDSLEKFGGILNTFSNGLGGSWTTPNSFDFRDSSGVKYYTIVYAEGGIYGYTWNFQVDPGCSVELIGSGWSGPGYDSLPPPVNCNLMKTEELNIPAEDLKIYPNPTYTNVTIQTHNFQENALLSLVDMNGREILNREVSGSKTQIDISHLPEGIYFVKLINEQNVKVGKFIKE